MKSNSVMTHVVNGGVITWTYSDGKTLAFDASKCPAPLGPQALIHGYTQKIADAAAISRDSTTGKPATVAEKRAAMERVVASLYAGQWNAPRAEGEGGLLFETLKRHYKGKKSDESIKAFLKQKAPKERAALLNSKKLRPTVDAIRAERGKATGLDGDAILATMPE